ncbi:DUF11 domain-containing protein [Hymenobacter sp. J193]|uniref:DUF7619 domain-containing protein n=1 Tax=Hymenobacter sp. J193 TaxID=2898429 RepID=UPI0021513175|nr:T9SS type A sorting domain-containing protein [Hymenobacter sp. J193]MCR5890011.1 DUF11 domain-containing protein [Hymenobacter sp. J193]
MNLLRFLVLSTFLFLCARPGQAQRPVWTQLANKTQVPGYGVSNSATDLRGNTYTWQTIGGPSAIGSASLTTLPNRTDPRTGEVLAWNLDVCLAKFKPNGEVAWVVQGTDGTFTNQATSMAIDERGNIYVSGFNWHNFRFGAHTVAEAGYFLARVDSAGTVQWVQHLADYPLTLDKSFQAPQLATDAEGNCLMLGHSRNETSLSGQPLKVTGHYDAYLAKCNAAGKYQWVKQLFSTTTSTNVPAIAAQLTADAAGNSVVAGTFSDLLTLGTNGPQLDTTPVENFSPRNTFVARFDRDGQLLWTRQGNSSYVSGAATDYLGNTYLTGYSSGGPTAFGELYLMASDFFVLKYAPNGTEQWLQGTTGGFTRGVQTDIDGNVYLAGQHSGPVEISPFSLPASTGGYYDGFLLSYTPEGAVRWLYGVGGPGNLDNVGTPGLDAQQNLYAVLTSDSLNYLDGQPVAGSRNASVLVRLAQRANRLAGTVYLDQNGNGRRDATEGPFPRPVALTDTVSQQLFTSESPGTGAFQAFVDTGSWVVRPAVIPTYYTLSQPAPEHYAGHFSAYGQVADTLVFGLQPLSEQPDLRVTLTPYGAARPGFSVRYRLTLENVGTTTLPAGTATVTLDGRMQEQDISSSPAANISNHTVSWHYPTLTPFARRELDIAATLPVNTTPGTQLATVAEALVEADSAPADNKASLTQTVTGSFDPNNIEVNYQQLTAAQLAAGQPLDYTIRFQNMGTDTAFAVVLTDTLDNTKLQVASLQLVANSHNCTWRLLSSGVLIVRFPGIQLPHRSMDALRSQGFVRFRVQPRTTLAPGAIIPNHADIIFDYNHPVRTNTATTAVLLPTALVAARSAVAWSAYPNPTTEALTIEATLPTRGTVRVELLDLLGRCIRQQSVVSQAGAFQQALDVRAVAPGVYVLRLQLPDGRLVSRQVVRR